MIYKTRCMFLIRSCYVHIAEDATINRCVHTRALEDVGEKPSRHENEGPVLIFFLKIIYDGRKPKARIAEIVK